jgi:SAM-dependent methyltransferase
MRGGVSVFCSIPLTSRSRILPTEAQPQESEMAHEHEKWEQFARENPDYYVYTPKVLASDTAEPFFLHGERLVSRILADVGALLPGREAALELGCGTGRLAIYMSKHFASLTAVDVAPSMLSRLAQNCERFGINNVQTARALQPWEVLPVDFLYSAQVFQHIEDFALIDAYLPRIARSLGRTGIGYLHFDTRPRTVAYRLRRVVPDPLLPRAWRRSIRRTRRNREDLMERLQFYGLEVIAEHDPNTDWHVFIVRAS